MVGFLPPLPEEQTSLRRPGERTRALELKPPRVASAWGFALRMSVMSALDGLVNETAHPHVGGKA